MYACKSTPQVDGILYTCTRFVVSKVHFEITMIAIMVVIILDYGYAWLEGSLHVQMANRRPSL